MLFNTFKDLVDNINYARIAAAIDVRDPFKKMVIEKELDNYNIKYVKGFSFSRSATIYALVGGKKQDIYNFVKWCLETYDNNGHYINRHAIFKTKIHNFVIF